MLDYQAWPLTQQKSELIQETVTSGVKIVRFPKEDTSIQEGINSTVQARSNLEQSQWPKLGPVFLIKLKIKHNFWGDCMLVICWNLNQHINTLAKI